MSPRLWRILEMRESRSAGLAALVVANAVPLVGVLALGWDVWAILLIYWLENGIVGLLGAARLATHPGDARVGLVARTTLVPFFAIHYGIFWLVHGVFVFALPVFVSDAEYTSPLESIGVDGLLVAAAALGLSHSFSFWRDWLRGGARARTAVMAQFMAPYPRLVILHLTIILGALLVATLGEPVALVALLVALKTGLDALPYLRSASHGEPY